MLQTIRPVLVVFALLTLITGVLYPGLVTVAGNLLFADEAQGSVIERDGKAVGSKLLAQPFTAPGYFWPRPSASTYNGGASAASNLAVTNPKQAELLKERVAALRAADPGNPATVPVDLVTASGSGLDPHISPEAAEYQVARVARARGLDEPMVRQLVAEATEGRTFGVLGEPRVNVLELNLALDARVK